MGERKEEIGEGLPKYSLIEHLEELRKRILYSLGFIFVTFSLVFFFSDRVFEIIALPLKRYLPSGSNLVFTRLQEPFTLYIKVSFMVAILISSPFIIYQIWLYISPGLYRKEKKYLLPFIFFSTFLFFSGVLFAYFVLFPNTCHFLLDIGKNFSPMISISEYFNLAFFVIMGTGAIFEMPIVIVFLSLMGVVTPQFLLKSLRYAIFIIFFLAALLSPTVDVVNLFIFAIPMVFLYLISILLSFIFYRRR